MTRICCCLKEATKSDYWKKFFERYYLAEIAIFTLLALQTCVPLLYRIAVSTSYGFAVFDLVRSKMVYATAVSVPSGKFVSSFLF